MLRVSFFVLLMLMLMVMAGCGTDDEVEVYEMRGRVVGEDFGGLALRIDHEPVEGYMDAMRMSFRLADPEEAQRVEVGDAVSFDYIVAPRDAYIRNLQVLPPETELDLEGLDADDDTLSTEPDTLP